MKTVVGIFKTRQAASEGVNLLKAAGFRGDKVIILTPDTLDPVVEKTVPTEDAEQPGMGKAIGSVVGGAVGLGAGALIANLLLPGIGPVLAVTFGAAAGGLGGAAAGAAAGSALENLLSIGVPKDEIFFMRMHFDRVGPSSSALQRTTIKSKLDVRSFKKQAPKL